MVKLKKSKKIKKNAEGFMDFEHMLRQYLGDKMYGSQGVRNNIKLVKKDLLKIINIIEERILTLDTTVRHKDMLLVEVERIRFDLKLKGTDAWTIIIHLLALVSRLLGYDYLKANINTPLYYQSTNQHYTQKILEGGDVMEQYNDIKNLIKIKRDLYFILKKENYSDFRISQALNISEGEIKKIKNSI